MRSRQAIQFGIFGLFVVITPVMAAESLDSRRQRDAAGNPSDLHFRLQTAGGARSFRPGERIPLALTFWSDSPAKYKLDAGTDDRSGRLASEQFILDRDDVADPYRDYFASGVMYSMMGGLRSFPVLAKEPVTIELNLNEWFRFDRPGTYHLYLKSKRLTRERALGESGERTVSFAAVSNMLEIVIAPDDPDWAAAKLREIEAVLAQPEPEWGKPGVPRPRDPLDDLLPKAREELRYLGTPGAVALAFRDARKPGRSLDHWVLLAARNREQMIAAYDEYLADPGTAIQSRDIRLRALFRYLRNETPSAEHERFAEDVHAEAVRLIPAAKVKSEAVRKISADAIASYAPGEAKAAGIVPPDDYGLSRAELIQQFLTFSEEQQGELLGKKWDLIRGTEIIPALQEVVRRAKPAELSAPAMPLQVWGVGGGLSETALRRLQELSPEAALRIVAADLQSGEPKFARFAVREVAARELPEAQAFLAQALAKHQFRLLPLVAKFGGTTLADAMRTTYLSKSWPCAEEDAFIAYFVRNLPDSGPASAQEFLQRSLANRAGRGCHHFLFGAVAAMVWKPVLERQAIESLNDPDPETVISAAGALGGHGSKAAEAPLWKRLEAWSERWRGRTAEFEVHPITGGIPPWESRVGPALRSALAYAKSWVLDEPRRQRLLGLCIDADCREEWQRPLSSVERRIDVSNGGAIFPAAFRVDGYSAPSLAELREKLSQYPRGTAFCWCPQVSSPFDTFTDGQRAEM